MGLNAEGLLRGSMAPRPFSYDEVRGRREEDERRSRPVSHTTPDKAGRACLAGLPMLPCCGRHQWLVQVGTGCFHASFQPGASGLNLLDLDNFQSVSPSSSSRSEMMVASNDPSTS